ncbi:MAG: hemC [Chloroflexi bacterium]|nr:hemC [Chloroflexota bacterium]
MRQTTLVIAALQRLHPTLECAVEVIRTEGDDEQGLNAAQIDGQGVFVRRIEAALLDGRIDVAIHSAKDMPSESTPGLCVAAFPTREDPRDALVSKGVCSLRELPVGALIGTGSPRRRAQLHDSRPDLTVEPLRGNVDTRIRRVMDGTVDAVVLAAAGLRRLGLQDAISEILDPSLFTPAVCQGILAAQTREGDRRSIEIISQLDDETTRACAQAERAVAIAIGASCRTPVGAFAREDGGTCEVSTFLADESGKVWRTTARGPLSDAQRLGTEAGMALLRSAAAGLIA